MRIVLAAAFLFTDGCDLSKALSGSSSSGTGGSNTSSAAAGSGLPTGVDCGTDQNTGVSLCLGISTCSDIVVDSESFPMCGFYIHGAAIDLECVCSDALCSIGPASTCDDAKALLSSSNEGTVCAQLSNGTCQTIANPVTTAAASSSSGTGTCDMDCLSTCAGTDPDCAEFCGC